MRRCSDFLFLFGFFLFGGVSVFIANSRFCGLLPGFVSLLAISSVEMSRRIGLGQLGGNLPSAVGVLGGWEVYIGLGLEVVGYLF